MAEELGEGAGGPPPVSGAGEAKNEAPFTRPNVTIPAHRPLTALEVDTQKRAGIVVMANWALTEPLRAVEHYSEGGDRLSGYAIRPGNPGRVPTYWDCSSAFSTLYKWGGAPDPNKLRYTGGFTGTLQKAMMTTTPAAAKPADGVIFGPGNGVHIVLLLERVGSDWHVFNNGGPDGAPPSRLLLSEVISYFGQGFERRWVRSLL